MAKEIGEGNDFDVGVRGQIIGGFVEDFDEGLVRAIFPTLRLTIPAKSSRIAVSYSRCGRFLPYG